MKFRSEEVIQELQGLEQQIAAVRRLGDALTRAFRDADLAGSTRATGDARSAFDAIATATMSIKQQVVPADGLGDTLESLAELVIRATRMVVIAEVNAVREEIRGPAAVGRGGALFRGPWQDIDDVVAFVSEELDRINAMWMPYRRGAGTSANRVLYRAAIRAAQHAVRALGSEPTFARFLRDACARTDWPAVRRACRQIVAALQVNLDAEPDRQLFTHPQALQPPVHLMRKRP
jgi:hypothetical protein